MKDAEYVEKMRHSLSHIMAAAIKSIWPTTKFGIGPAVDDGFYYDIDLDDKTVSEADFGKIEKRMREIIKKNLSIERSEMSVKDAEKWAKDEDQPYKLELIKDLGDEKLSFYKIGDFLDLCKGPHLDKTGEVGVFKLLRVAGAYWRGDEHRPQLQRIYGLAFATQEKLDARLEQIEEAKKRDHRKLGKELDLFHYSQLIGSGLPLFTPRGTVLRDAINDLAQSYRLRNGYQKVWIPHIANLETYKVSGHLEKFPELLYFKSQESGDELALKPVSCPHHSQIFASLPRSYKELPIKYLETTTVYRDEKKGELGGLTRVRSITQDDSHVFCTEEQVGDVFAELIESAKELYALVDMKLALRLSFKDDSDGYIGDNTMWEKAQTTIQEMADKFEMDYTVGLGEAAMYGPKMDFMATDALGRETQLATVQLDYALPGRFGLEYTDANGDKKTPIMVHCALVGSIERFMSIYIEHTAGKFPIWCAPEQLRIIKVKDSPELDKFVADVQELADEHDVRATVDDSNNSVGKKIRSAEVLKVPYTVVVGEKEVGSGKLPLRVRNDLVVDSNEPGEYSPEQLIKSIANEAAGRVSRSSL